MIYKSQFERFLSEIDDELERRDDGCWPLTEHAPELLTWLRQHGVTVVEDDPCPYDFAHTRHWCGHAECRDS